MSILANVSAAIQRLFGKTVETAAQSSGVIQRQRKFTAVSLLKTFVFGFLKNPAASAEQLAQMAVQCGVDVTPQAIDQRQSPKLVAFLQQVFQEGAKEVVAAEQTLAPILERFPKVLIVDGSTITLPDSARDQFPGCGGSHESGRAALKLQTELDLRSGAVTVQLEPGRSSDGATTRQQERHGPGSLRITDLGYFNVGVFAEQAAADEYFLSRLLYGTHVRLRSADADGPVGPVLNVLSWLAKQPGPFVDQPIYLGQKQQLVCRLIAWRLPPEQADRRRHKLRQEMRKKKGKEPSVERLAWCDWTILVTNVPVSLVTPEEAAVMYRARWQIELLFKRWKALNLVAMLRGATVVRQLVGLWSRLIMSLVQHWLVIASAWGDPTKSLSKVCQALRDFAARLATSMDNPLDLERVLAEIAKVVAKTCRRNKRSKPGTFELLNDVSLLDFC